jgi:hypothetical protein
MASARPLRDVFADLAGAPSATGDPAALLRDQGHAGLPDELVAEAVVSYAETAPVEVAEHLAPYVTAHSAVGAEPAPAGDWLDLLGTAPDVAGEEPAGLDDLTPGPGKFDEVAGLDFGMGAGPAAAIEPDEAPREPDEAELDVAELDEPELDEPELDEPELDDAGWVATAHETDLTADEAGDDDGQPDRETLG